MAAFFNGVSEAREVSSSPSEFALQQHSFCLMNPLSHAFVHSPPSLAVVPTTVGISMCTPPHNSFFGSPVDPDPTGREVVSPGPGGSHGFELLPRPPLAAVSPGNGKKLSLSLSQTQTQTQTQTAIDHHVEQGNSPVSTVTHGVVFGSTRNAFDHRYLKAAQELLDEIVSIGNAKNRDSDDVSKGKLKVKTEFSGDRFCGSVGGRNSTAGDLTAAYRQELQIKKAKLASMVEEVEQRYRHYHDQMQAIESSFEQAAGFGSAKPYTSLALQTISKQFRCLKDAITSQIKLISKCLGDEYIGSSRPLRFVDQTQLRHLGIMQQHDHSNAWRPQRGLPERAVSILRSWLFEHFLHPYPKDMDKQILAKQTGLTKSQVSNWFINARVRLWKPMVEEMYSEEMKGQGDTKDINDEDHNDLELGVSSSKHPPNNASDTSMLENPNPRNNNNSVSDQCSSSIVSTNCLAAASRHGGMFSPQKKLRANDNVNDDFVLQNTSSTTIVSFETERKQQMEQEEREANNDNMIHFNGGFGNYHHQVMYGNAVSLSLGLPHSHDRTFSNVQFGNSHPIEFSGVSSPSTYQNLDVTDKKRFVSGAAPLLPDFFA